MKLSTKGRYGLRALADLAVHTDEKNPVSLTSIAGRQNISDKYLENMFSSLKNAGLIKSVKGSGGGYLLSRPAKAISAGEVLRVLEGDLSIVDDIYGEAPSLHQYLKETVWDQVSIRLNRLVDSITLEDLIAPRKFNQ